ICTFDPDGPSREECGWTREMVNDEYLSVSDAMVVAVEDLTPHLSTLKSALDALDIPAETQQGYFDLLIDTRQVQFPVNGVWRQPDSCTDAYGRRTACSNGVRLGGAPSGHTLRTVEAMTDGVEGADGEEVAQNLLDELEGLS